MNRPNRLTLPSHTSGIPSPLLAGVICSTLFAGTVKKLGVRRSMPKHVNLLSSHPQMTEINEASVTQSRLELVFPALDFFYCFYDTS